MYDEAEGRVLRLVPGGVGGMLDPGNLNTQQDLLYI